MCAAVPNAITNDGDGPAANARGRTRAFSSLLDDETVESIRSWIHQMSTLADGASKAARAATVFEPPARSGTVTVGGRSAAGNGWGRALEEARTAARGSASHDLF